eukprot:6766743-Prorocentrum_lima.AAC.1
MPRMTRAQCSWFLHLSRKLPRVPPELRACLRVSFFSPSSGAGLLKGFSSSFTSLAFPVR